MVLVDSNVLIDIFTLDVRWYDRGWPSTQLSTLRLARWHARVRGVRGGNYHARGVW